MVSKNIPTGRSADASCSKVPAEVGENHDATFEVALMGASLHTGNRGVSALGASLATLVWRSQPHATISFLIGNRDSRDAEVYVGGRWRPVQTVNYRLSPRASLGQQLWWIVLMSALHRIVPFTLTRRFIARNGWIRRVLKADFVGDIRGGDSFSDIYGWKGFVLACLPIFSVIWLRRGIHLLPQTYGPFRSRFAEWCARYILLHAESVWCRDRMSLQEVSRLTRGRRQGSLCPDVAFALEAIRPDMLAVDPPLIRREEETVIGLNVSGLVYHGGYTRDNMFGLKLDYVRFVRRLVEQLLADPSNRIVLVPHTFAPDGRVESDPSACRQVQQTVPSELRDRVHLVTKDYDQHHIKGVIGGCDFFIGSRMHACIASLSQGIPTVGVAYSRKFAGVFETVGAAECVIDGRTEDEQEALDRVQRLFERRHADAARLRAQVTNAQNELFALFNRIVASATPVPGAIGGVDARVRA